MPPKNLVDMTTEELRPALRTRDGRELCSNEQVRMLAQLYLYDCPEKLRPQIRALVNEVARYRERPLHGAWYGDGLPPEIAARLETHYAEIDAANGGDIEKREDAPPLDLARALLRDAGFLLTTGNGGAIEMDASPAAVDRAYNCINDAYRRIEAAQKTMAVATAVLPDAEPDLACLANRIEQSSNLDEGQKMLAAAFRIIDTRLKAIENATQK